MIDRSYETVFFAISLNQGAPNLMDVGVSKLDVSQLFLERVWIFDVSGKTQGLIKPFYWKVLYSVDRFSEWVYSINFIMFIARLVLFQETTHAGSFIN